MVAGDPHVTTFDGRTFSMFGKCAYSLVDHCHYDNSTGKSFELVIKNSECTESNGFASCARTLVLKMLKLKKDIVMSASKLASGQHVPTVTIAGKAENWAKTNDYMIQKVGKENVLVTFTPGISIQWTGRNAYVTVSPNFENQTCGLCGTFNHNSQDDFHTKSGSTESSVSVFTNHWIYKDSNINNDDNCNKWNEDIDACDIFTAKRANAESQCAIIKSTTGPFKLCHGTVPPEEYYKMCRQDGCKCGSCLCNVISSYAKVCMNKGIMISDWRATVPTCASRMWNFLQINICLKVFKKMFSFRRYFLSFSSVFSSCPSFRTIFRCSSYMFWHQSPKTM